MATDWTSVRIRRATLERLYQVRASLRHAADLGTYEPTARHVTDIPLDDVIQVLLDRDAAKRERAARSRKARGRTKGRTAGESANSQG